MNPPLAPSVKSEKNKKKQMKKYSLQELETIVVKKKTPKFCPFCQCNNISFGCITTFDTEELTFYEWWCNACFQQFYVKEN